MSPLDPGIKPPPRGEDLPHTDGEPMETGRHYDQGHLLVHTLKDAWHGRGDVFVAGNMAIYFSELQAKKNDFRAPDVFVVMDTVKKERKSWVVWEEEGRTPDLVIELLSESTERVDRGEKMRTYARLLHVAEYYLFEPFSARLEAYALDPSTRTYGQRTPDAAGRYASPVTGLSLGVVHGRYGDVDADWLRWIGPDGEVLPTGAELAAQARARADQELARADQEAARAAQEAARAAQEAARAAQEAARADEALRRVAELEAQLGTQRGKR